MDIAESLNRISVYNEALAQLREFADRETSDQPFENLLALADIGLPIAALAVAAEFELGKNAPLDRERARHYYARAADLGIAVADFHLGRMHYDDKDYQLAVPRLLRAAERGDLRTSLYALANVYLGTCLEHGLAIPVNPELAFSCYRTAAVLGDPSGLYYVAKCYQTGFGVQKNLERMEILVQEACKMNDARAWYMLGGLYLRGEILGTREEAMDCMKKAAELKLPEALVFYGEHLATIKESTEVDNERAVSYLNEAIQANQYRAYYVLAYLYSFGKGIESNLEKALELCNQAAKHEIEDAKLTLASISTSGTQGLTNWENWFQSRHHGASRGAN